MPVTPKTTSWGKGDVHWSGMVACVKKSTPTGSPIWCTSIRACVLRVSDSVTPWTEARQPPLSTGFSRQEYWSGVPFPPLGDLPDPGVEPMPLRLLHWQADPLPLSHAGSHLWCVRFIRPTSMFGIFPPDQWPFSYTLNLDKWPHQPLHVTS